ncbi:MAG: helix-turn-helix domain-containing protein [Ruminococcaceae bacterium]|nr:helix-turn-helix domain-containing protein [Oscillospiraceae bacterium]
MGNNIPLYGFQVQNIFAFHAVGPWPRPDIKPWKNFHYIPGVTMEQEAHHYHELLFVNSPIPLRHTGNGRTYETTSHAIIYRAPYTLHSTMCLSTQQYDRYVLWFNPDTLSAFGGICDLGKLGTQAECCIPITSEQMQSLQPLLEMLIKAQKKSRNNWQGMLAAVLAEVNDLHPEDGLPETVSGSYIQQLMHYIAEHISEELSIPFLAEKYFISPSKLTADFRAATSISLHEYISGIRVNWARMWLGEGVPIPIIAQRCGFTHESSFIRMFRSVTGMTPGEYRTRLRR